MFDAQGNYVPDPPAVRAVKALSGMFSGQGDVDPNATPWSGGAPTPQAPAMAQAPRRPVPPHVAAPPSNSITPVPKGDSASTDAGGATSGMAADAGGSISASWMSKNGSPVRFSKDRSGTLYSGSGPVGGGGEVGHWKGTGRQVNSVDQPFLEAGPGEHSFGSAMGTTADLMGRASTRSMLDAAFGTDQQLHAPDYSEQMERSYAGDTAMNRAKLAASMSEVVPGVKVTPPGAKAGISMPMSRADILNYVQGIANNPMLMRQGAVNPYLMEVTRRQAEIDSYKRMARGLVPDGKGGYHAMPVDKATADALNGYAADLEESRNQYLKTAQIAGGAAAGRSIAGGNIERDFPVEGAGLPAMAGASGH